MTPNERQSQNSSGSLAVGTILDDRYEIVSRIGAGGMGEVFRARDRKLEVWRCIKTVKPSLAANPRFLARFLREARIARGIEHPNIARVHELVLHERGPYLVAELIEGQTLGEWLIEHGAMPVSLACEVASQVLAGLAHLHDRGLLHRDIAFGNVMLAGDAEDVTVKIIDLGITKEVDPTGVAMTQSGVLIGNPRSMSPEQLGALGEGETIDGRSDLYSLGLVLYELLTGVPPFSSETSHGFVALHLTQTPPRFATVRPGLAIPQKVEHVVLRALEKDRRRRYADAREMAAALAPFARASSRAELEAARRAKEEAESRAFEAAWESGTSAAWDAFLRAHADSARVEEARRCREEAADFAEVAATRDVQLLRAFLRRWPEGRHRMDAALRKEALLRTPS